MKKYNKAPHTLAVPAKRDSEEHQLHKELVCSSSSFAPNPNPGETEGLHPGGGRGQQELRRRVSDETLRSDPPSPSPLTRVRSMLWKREM